MVNYIISPKLSNESLHALFSSAWANYKKHDLASSLQHCKLWICAYESHQLIGFVKVVWDGGIHGFVLDTTVHADYQRQGIGKELLRRAATASREEGIEWLHADFEPHLEGLYTSSGFKNSRAGVLKLT